MVILVQVHQQVGESEVVEAPFEPDRRGVGAGAGLRGLFDAGGFVGGGRREEAVRTDRFADPRDELGHVEWLDDVFFHLAIETLRDPFALGAVAQKHERWAIAVGPCLHERVEDHEPVEFPRELVAHDDVVFG